MKPRIAVDAMGGDHGPKEVVDGSVMAAQKLGVELLLVGRKEVVLAELEGRDNIADLRVVDARDAIAMDEPIEAVKAKPEASINVGMGLIKQGEADAFVTAGNTGATLTAALLRLGRIPGIGRPALGMVVPTGENGVTMLIDVGANADSKPAHLVQFAYMGSAAMEHVHGIVSPRVGLISIGEEDSKGNQLTLEVNRALRASDLNFVGNIEAGQLPGNPADVAVMDGFTGNVLIKTVEGVAEMFFGELKRAVRRTPWNLAAGLVLSRDLRKSQRRLDYAEYGGAQLLGVNGVVFVAHGRSSARAILGGIRAAREAVKNEVLGKLCEVAERMPARGIAAAAVVAANAGDGHA